MQTFEQVDTHVEEHGETAKTAVKKKDLAGIWKVARPILVLVSSFALIPKKWRDIVAGLIAVIDATAQ